MYNSNAKKGGDFNMFEEEFDGFGFHFEGDSEDGKFCCDSVPEFQMITKFLPVEEVGISFNGKIKVDEMLSVITDKKVKLDSPEVATETYQKVMEMRELTEAERTNVSKVKLVLKKLLEVFFRGQKWRRNLCIFFGFIVGFDIAVENYLGAILMFTYILFYTSPIKFYKELRKIFSKKRQEELSNELEELNVLSGVYSVDDDASIQLYFKLKGN